MRISGLLVAAVALTGAIVCGRAAAQAVPSRAEWVVEQTVRDRWMHGRQHPPFSPFAMRQRWLFVDSIRGVADERQVFLTIERNAYGRDSALIVSDANGRIVRFHAGQAPYRRLGPTYPGDSLRMANSRRFQSEGSLALVETRVWDVVPTFPREPAAGAQWTDTIAREAVDGPYRQSLTGTRTSRIVGDTNVGGRRLWIVRDSAVVRYHEQYLERERTLDTTVEVSRTASGVERGTHLLDAASGLFHWRQDTMLLSGEAVLRYPDGRTFQSPARYERSRGWLLHDSTGYAARQQERRATAARGFGGMVRVPTELQRRIMEGDAGIRDSLLAEWRRSADPNESTQIFQNLMSWSGRDEQFRKSLDGIRIGAGDTAFLYKRLAERAYSRRPPTDTAELRRMIPFMEDPGIAWGFNLSRDWLYENLSLALSVWPPASVVRESDPAACTPAACRLLGTQWRVAREPRTRDVGLVALYASDPALWADTVLAYTTSRRPLLRMAAQLARGIVPTYQAASRPSMPPANSDWRAWLHWMNGRDSAYAAIRAELATRYAWARDTVTRPRFDDTHRVAIRMYTRQTGRDMVAELRAAYQTATSEMARLVFGTLLQGLGELRLSADQIAEEFVAGVPERATLARQALVELFRRAQTPMDSTRAIPLFDRLITATVELVAAWPVIAVNLSSAERIRPQLHARRGRVRLSSANLPRALREKWSELVDVVSTDEARQADPREAVVVYTILPVTAVGRFARLEIRAREQLARDAAEGPAHYASGVTYYLMDRDGEWVIVAMESWVT